MTSADLPLGDAESLARFIFVHDHIRSDGSVSLNAFMPPRDLQLSVTRSDGMALKVLWQRAMDSLAERRKASPAQTFVLRGSADISAGAVRESKLDVVPHALKENPEHAHIVGWPASTQKPLQKHMAQELASRSVFRVHDPHAAAAPAETPAVSASAGDDLAKKVGCLGRLLGG